jgi:hypothetical protein
MSYTLFVPFAVCGSGVKGSQTASLTTKYFLRGLFVCIESGGEILLLLFDMIESLVNVSLLSLSSQYVTV